jgi:hypothetical protein
MNTTATTTDLERLISTNQTRQAAFNKVATEIIQMYEALELPIARLDAKYGQCTYSKKFFVNPKKALKGMLINRIISDMGEIAELGSDWAAIAEESLEDYGFSGFACSVNFEDYLAAIAINAMS